AAGGSAKPIPCQVVPMELGTLIHTMSLNIAGRPYEIAIYSRPDGRYSARTVFAPGDVIVHDGSSVAAVLSEHQRLLPLAIDSRLLLREMGQHL
ncbi:MAG: hypothetical protein P8X63_14070, partial [Desulfuromonadaceae bacterium]